LQAAQASAPDALLPDNPWSSTILYWSTFTPPQWSSFTPPLTSQNEYEVLVHFRFDASESRLHPTPRVQEVQFRADKVRTMREMLSDLPEAVAICSGGCRALADKYLGLQMFLVPVMDSSAALLVGTLRDPSTGDLINARSRVDG
jgi:hypothetical protein